MPDQELPLAAGGDHRRRAVAGLLGGERSPQLFACVLVEGDGDGAFAADEADQLFAVNEGMAAETPNRRLGFVLLLQLLRPENSTLRGVEAEQVAFRTKRIDLAGVDGGRGSRA